MNFGSMKDQTMDTMESWLWDREWKIGDALVVEQDRAMCQSWADDDPMVNWLHAFGLPPKCSILIIVSELAAVMAMLTDKPSKPAVLEKPSKSKKTPKSKKVEKPLDTLPEDLSEELEAHRELFPSAKAFLFRRRDALVDTQKDAGSGRPAFMYVQQLLGHLPGISERQTAYLDDTTEYIVVERPSGEKKMPRIWLNCDEFF